MIKDAIIWVGKSIQGQIKDSSNTTGATKNYTPAVKVALRVIFGTVAVIAAIMIILGGITYATSQGDPGKVTKGKKTIIYGIIGLVISLLAFAIVTFVFDAFNNG